MIRRAIQLGIFLILVIAVGVAMRRLATLTAGEDTALVRGFLHHRSAGLTMLARSVSWLGRSAVLLACAAAIAVSGRVRKRETGGLTVLVGVLGAIVIQNIDKAIVGRPRPPVTRLEHVSGTSFPSGHATEAAAFFLVLAILIVRRSPSRPMKTVTVAATTALVAAVAVSRVYLGVHYPSDVIAGVLLGGIWGVGTVTALHPNLTDSAEARPAR